MYSGDVDLIGRESKMEKHTRGYVEEHTVDTVSQSD